MANTTNFGWETPDDTDLVKDGAAAMRTLGNAIDASLVDLKGGTTGQVLSKNTNTDMDFTWVTPNDADAIQNSIVDAKGDLISATADNTPTRLASSGVNGQVLTVDTTTSTGLKWAALPATALTLISRQTFSNVASISFANVLTTTYENYLVYFTKIVAGTLADNFQLQLETSGGVQATSYYGNSIKNAYNATTFTFESSDNATAFNICDESNNLNGQLCLGGNGFGASGRISWTGLIASDTSAFGATVYGLRNSAATYTGITFKSSSSNITGTIAIYGLAEA